MQHKRGWGWLILFWHLELASFLFVPRALFGSHFESFHRCHANSFCSICVSQAVPEEAGDRLVRRGFHLWTAGCSACCHSRGLVRRKMRYEQVGTVSKRYWLAGDSSCRYSGRTDCGCTYQMTVCLLGENQDIIQEFKADPVTLDPDSDDCSWKQVHQMSMSIPILLDSLMTWLL